MAHKSNIKDFIQWLLFGFLIVIVGAYFFLSRNESYFPSTQPTIELAANDKPNSLPVISKVAPFSLTNHLGDSLTETNVLGRPWLANVIFTRCPTVCPRITQTIAKISPQLPDQLSILSITTDPDFDTASRLNDFMKLHGVKKANWHFVTGAKKTLMNLMVRDLKMISIPKGAKERDNPNDLFVHSNLLILVDPKGRVRKSFESDSKTLTTDINKALTKLKDSD